MNRALYLQLIREEMDRNNFDFYLVPSVDAHNSEYVPEFWDRRSWLSGFDGSAGEILITKHNAYLWTDGRYYLQAHKQLNQKDFTLLKDKSFLDSLNNIFNKELNDTTVSKSLGVDPKLISIAKSADIKQVLIPYNISLIAHEENLVDLCRLHCGDNITPKFQAIYEQESRYSGVMRIDKITWLQRLLHDYSVDGIALNVLDEIAWLFNMRGSDILFNPLFISYSLIEKEAVTLFIDDKLLDMDLKLALELDGIKIQPYDYFDKALKSFEGIMWLSNVTANYHMSLSVEKKFIGKTPIAEKKACKNTTEVLGAAIAHKKDAVAVINFLYWLENNWQSGINELKCIDQLDKFRQKNENYKGSSFHTISAFGENGAICHYRATPESCKVIDDTNLYLLDSGGQYLEGTTDITRTIHLGSPSLIQKQHYTMVLKGHLALRGQLFPDGTAGENLDVLARSYLWNHGLDYMHGTGHGVGSFLCVHEGPASISKGSTNVPLKMGMILSNEPGLYLECEYGIRIENLLVVGESKNNEISYGPFYEFKDLTLVPYAKKLIDFDLLTKRECLQIKDYYTQIINQVRPALKKDQQLWLDNEVDLSGLI